MPHLDDDELECYSDLLRHCSGYVEYGSGASTLYAAGFGVPVVSVETDPKFADIVRGRLGRADNVVLRHIDVGPTGDWGVPRRLTPCASGLGETPLLIESLSFAWGETRQPD